MCAGGIKNGPAPLVTSVVSLLLSDVDAWPILNINTQVQKNVVKII